MNYKLVANQDAGKYKAGDQITDADEMAKALAGSLRKRFVKVPLHPGEIQDPPADPEPAPGE